MNDSADNNISNQGKTEYDSFDDVCERRFTRRGFVKAGIATGSVITASSLSGCEGDDLGQAEQTSDHSETENAARSRYNFIEIEHGGDQYHHVAPDHEAKVLIRWGDAMFEDSPEFEPAKQSVNSQLKQFGYNNDYVGYLALVPKPGQEARALLCVNHEYPIAGLMFPNFPPDGYQNMSAEQVAITQAATGNSIVEVALTDGEWSVSTGSGYNRRITALDTAIAMSGPAAGHSRLQTTKDPSGTKVIGTLNNCAGGMTPWGTFLTCEENFNYHFLGELPKGHSELQNHQRYNVPNDYTFWGKHDTRFDLGVEPNEPNRFGWVVEVDPLDPSSTPKKRTALGRFKHEGGETVMAPDGRLVVYMGDDQRFEYLYKFVSRDKVDLEMPENNKDLLDHGTLYVAKFHDQGYIQWLALDHNNARLQSEFESQAEILIETRRAADILGATPMDRPEDVVPNPTTGKVYVMLTNNRKRKEATKPNPREKNYFGHIIELSEPNNDFASTRSEWNVIVRCGDPDKSSHDADWNPNTSRNGWFASPDNAVVDPAGRLWIATDQGGKETLSGTNDGLWALETDGPLRGTGKMFFRAPMGAELTGPVFSEDGESLFIAVQHPGDHEGPEDLRVENASTLWPDFNPSIPPRPSIVVVRRKVGGPVG